MIYKFKSKASGDIIMLGAQGDRLLALLGREPAARGIIEPADMQAALTALQAAMAGAESQDRTEAARAAGDEAHEEPVSLRSRLWPMIDMLQRASAAGVPVVWGV